MAPFNLPPDQPQPEPRPVPDPWQVGQPGYLRRQEVYLVAVLAEHSESPEKYAARLHQVSAVSWNADDVIDVALAHFAAHYIGWRVTRVLSVELADYTLRPRRPRRPREEGA